MDPETPAGALPDVLPRIQAILASVGVPDVALTGAVALGVWTVPRFSADVDLCGVLPKESVDRLLALHDGFAVGPSEKVLQDLADVVAIVRVREDELDRNYLDVWLTAKEREIIDAAARGDQEAMLKLLDQP